MKFMTYQKIPNKLNGKLKDLITTIDKWVATEKVHGCNFSFYVNKKSIECGRRHGFLTDTDIFHDYINIKDKYTEQLNKLYEMLKVEYKNVDYIILYGELFGGIYPNTETLSKSKPVQKGVYYSPNKEFLAYDLTIVTKSNNVFELDFEKLHKYCTYAKIPIVPILKIGGFQEVMDITTEVNSAIPDLYNLPKLETNRIEGIIVRPYNYVNEKLKIKIKNKNFGEISGSANLISSYVTKNRFNCILSKHVKTTDFSVLFDEYIKDIVDDYLKTTGKSPKISKKFLNRTENFCKRIYHASDLALCVSLG